MSRTLARQHDLLANLLERLQRGVALVTVDMDKLNSCRQQMNKDLKDKVIGCRECNSVECSFMRRVQERNIPTAVQLVSVAG